MATGAKSIQQRVSAAWLALLARRRKDLPEVLREAFAVIEAERLVAPEDATTLSDREASAAADHLVQLVLRLWHG